MLVPPPVVVVAPNSYKGSVSATAAAAALSRGLARVWPDGERRICPMADGGEGTLDAIFSRGGRRGSARVSGASGAPIDAAFGLIEGDAIAVIESAQVVGLTEANGIATAVEQRSTRGLGELVRTLLDAGIRKFMIGLGGSSTNDAGAGMLATLGVKSSTGRVATSSRRRSASRRSLRSMRARSTQGWPRRRSRSCRT